MNTTKILLVDDHPLFRLGLENIINRVPYLKVIDHAENTDEGFDKFKKIQPDLVITDLSFPLSSGLKLVKKIRESQSNCPILIISMHEETFWAEQALQGGANGYLQKDSAPSMVIDAIEKTANGEIYLSHSMQQKVLRRLSGVTANNTSLSQLSRREVEVFQYMAQGYNTHDIAQSLFISVKTVQTHQANIKSKLKANSLKELRELAENLTKSRDPNAANSQ